MATAFRDDDGNESEWVKVERADDKVAIVTESWAEDGETGPSIHLSGDDAIRLGQELIRLGNLAKGGEPT